jgi:hypothetical protein
MTRASGVRRLSPRKAARQRAGVQQARQFAPQGRLLGDFFGGIKAAEFAPGFGCALE